MQLNNLIISIIYRMHLFQRGYRNFIHRVQEKKGATDFFAITFTNIDGFS